MGEQAAITYEQLRISRVRYGRLSQASHNNESCKLALLLRRGYGKSIGVVLFKHFLLHGKEVVSMIRLTPLKMA